MLKQIFRENVPIELLHSLLDKICLKTDKYYFVDNNAYRKILFHKYHIPFLEELLKYYHKSKSFYVTRNFNYNSFVNIIRQICKSNGGMFASNIKYNESKYNIDYFVYFER